jgi:hypothetical protein
MGGLQVVTLAVAALGIIDGLNHESATVPIVIGVVAAVGLALGTLATIFLGRMMGRQVRAAVSSIGTSTAELLAVASA